VTREYQRAYYEANKERRIAQSTAWNKANPERRKAIERRHEYGTDGAALFEQQQGLCGVCSVDLATLPSNRKHLDHCHETKKVRAWLCHGCNIGLGAFKDNPARLRSAADYLEKHK
jgi:hypothetical protein